MKIKDGVNIRGINIKMRKVLIQADRIWRELGEELVVTAGLDGDHSKWSFHYYGMAVDLRTRYFSDSQIFEAAEKLSNVLGLGYQVIIHKTHIHVEYDPKSI